MARLQAGMRTTELAVREGLDPKLAAARVASFHRSAVADVKAHNRAILGGGAKVQEITTVDGKRGAPLESVKLDGGRIDTLFPFPVAEILGYIDYLLVTRSPIGPPGGAGTYNRSHRLFADGSETNPEAPKLDASEWVFVSTLPYSRKIEGVRGGRKPQGKAPKEGVYQGAVDLANQKFGNVARIRFTFEGVTAGDRYPAIRIGLR
jgi:hypothetical protein